MAHGDSTSFPFGEDSSDHFASARWRATRRRHRRSSIGDATPTMDQVLESLELPTPATTQSPRMFRLLSRILGPFLDTRLAMGESPDAGPLLAVRSRSIVSPTSRWNIADWWLDLLAQARQPVVAMDPRVPIVRSRVLRVDSQIRDLAASLVAPIVTVRGVAMAYSLLCDGTGPVYNPSSADDLATTLREIIRRLDPTN